MNKVKVAKELVKLAKELTAGEFDDKISVNAGEFDDKVSITAGQFDSTTINQLVTDSINDLISRFNHAKNRDKDEDENSFNISFVEDAEFNGKVQQGDIKLKFYLGTQNSGKTPVVLLYTDAFLNDKQIFKDSSELTFQYRRDYIRGFNESWVFSKEEKRENVEYKVKAYVQNWLKNISGKMASIIERNIK